MQAVEFETDAQQNTITIPEQYSNLYSKHLKLIVMWETNEAKQTNSLLELSGTWDDTRSPEQIVNDIYSSRV